MIDKCAPDKESKKNMELPLIKCYCGTQILLVPNVKAMNKAIETHVEKHRKQKLPNQKEAESEAERIREYLITQVLSKASEA